MNKEDLVHLQMQHWISVRHVLPSDECWIREEWSQAQRDLFYPISKIVAEETDYYIDINLQGDLCDILKHWKYPSAFFIAEDNQGKRLGTVAAKRSLKTPEKAEICKLFTVSTARRTGVGSLLLSHCENWLKQDQCIKLELETTIFQVAATNLYLKHGFKLFLHEM